MKVYYKVTQKYNLSNHPKKTLDPTKKIGLMTANSSETGIETSFLILRGSSVYAPPTEFALEGSFESTSYRFNKSGINRAVEPGLIKTNLYEEMRYDSDIKLSKDYPPLHYIESVITRFRALMSISPSPSNLVAEVILNTVSSEDPGVGFLDGGDTEEIMSVGEAASNNDFENWMYMQIFKEQQELPQQQQQYLFAPRTE